MLLPLLIPLVLPLISKLHTSSILLLSLQNPLLVELLQEEQGENVDQKRGNGIKLALSGLGTNREIMSMGVVVRVMEEGEEYLVD